MQILFTTLLIISLITMVKNFTTGARNHTINIKDLGAKGNGYTMNTK